MKDRKEVDAAAELHAIAVHMYATAAYPGNELNIRLHQLKELFAADQEAYTQLHAAVGKEAVNERRVARKATLQAIGNYKAEHPLVVKLHQCRETLIERGPNWI